MSFYSRHLEKLIQVKHTINIYLLIIWVSELKMDSTVEPYWPDVVVSKSTNKQVVCGHSSEGKSSIISSISAFIRMIFVFQVSWQWRMTHRARLYHTKTCYFGPLLCRPAFTGDEDLTIGIRHSVVVYGKLDYDTRGFEHWKVSRYSFHFVSLPWMIGRLHKDTGLLNLKRLSGKFRYGYI